MFEMKRHLRKIGGCLKKIVALYITSFLLFNLFILSPNPITPVVPASAGRYGEDVNLSAVDGSVTGEGNGAFLESGIPLGVKGSGDVNGDGYDDIVMSYYYRHGNSSLNDTVYLFFGRADRWSMDMDPKTADASFITPNTGGGSRLYSTILGDVNGDGFDDIAIGNPGSINESVGYAEGMIYLVFGKASGWNKNVSLSSADASFHGVWDTWDYIGKMMAGAGDVNGDGYDDFLVGSADNYEIAYCAGKVYLILGKKTGWSKNVNITTADASYRGYIDNGSVGEKVGGVGDVNADGYDDFVFISVGYHGVRYAKVYLIFGMASGWTKNTNVTEANVTYFDQVYYSDEFSFAGGDINGDGIDDLLIGDKYGTNILFRYFI